MTRGNDLSGTLIAVEGIDGSGKSTAVEAVVEWADEAGEPVVTTEEPVGDIDGDAPPLSRLFRFADDRRRHGETLTEWLAEGNVVVCDRYVDSTRAYQTHAVAADIGIDLHDAADYIDDLFEPWVIEPDITIYIDTPIDVALSRTADEEPSERRLRQARYIYESLYGPCDPSVRIIDGTQSRAAVRHQVINVVKAQLASGEPTATGGATRTYADAISEDL